MRVCIITENHPMVLMGGAEYQTHLLAEELARRSGTTVTYLARRVPAEANARTLPYKVRGIGNFSGIRRRAVFFDSVLLKQALSELKPDVIYEQMRQSYAGICADYAQRYRIPFFLHMASEWDIDPTLFPHAFSANTPFDVIESWIGRSGLRRATHLIAQTAAQERKLQERFDRPTAMIVRNFQPIPESLAERPAGRLRVLWVGNIKPVKRPELYAELAAALAHRTDLHFDMVGRPWIHPRAEPMMKQIASLPNLTFHGELPIAKVNELMSQASLYVNTSSHEGFPNTFIQAWAQGAVLLSLVVDPYDGMEKLGIGFTTGTIAKMAAKITELADQPAMRHHIAQRSFEFAHKNHSLLEGARLADAMLSAANAAKTQ